MTNRLIISNKRNILPSAIETRQPKNNLILL